MQLITTGKMLTMILALVTFSASGSPALNAMPMHVTPPEDARVFRRLVRVALDAPEPDSLDYVARQRLREELKRLGVEIVQLGSASPECLEPSLWFAFEERDVHGKNGLLVRLQMRERVRLLRDDEAVISSVTWEESSTIMLDGAVNQREFARAAESCIGSFSRKLKAYQHKP